MPAGGAKRGGRGPMPDTPAPAPALSGDQVPGARPSAVAFPLRVALAGVLLAYVALALGYALLTPPWNNPDEPAHFNYAAQVATTATLPILQPGDWDAARLERLKASQFRGGEPLDGIRYEGHQPPLYYLLAAPLLRAAGGLPRPAQLLALRLLSVALGAVVVVLAAVTAWRALPSCPLVGVAAAAIVAFLPMHTAMSAAANNDLLAEAVAAALLLTLVAGLQKGFGRRGLLALGLLAGFAVLAKLTVYAYLPLAAATVAWRTWQDTPPGAARFRALARSLLTPALPAVLLAGWWLLRGAAVYGWGDPLGSRRHDAVVVGQPRWPGLDLPTLLGWLRTLGQSFVGQFGWMGIVLPPPVYLAVALLLLAAVAGLLLPARGRPLPTMPRPVVALCLAAVALVALQLVWYNLSFYQAQGRYLFPALVPIALLAALGWTRLAAVLPAPLQAALVALPVGAAGLYLPRLGGPPGLLLTVGAGGAAALLLGRRLGAAFLPLALVAVLALLDAITLVRFVAPAFR